MRKIFILLCLGLAVTLYGSGSSPHEGGGGGGEANTGSNQGAGVGTFDNKNGVDFEHRSLVPGSNKVTIALDAINKEIDIDIDESNLDHTALSNSGSNSHAQIDTHLGDGSVHFTEGSIDHANIIGAGVNPHSALDTHLSDGTLHFLQTAIDHTLLQNIGVNSHADIDTHITDGTKHFTESSIDHASIQNVGVNSHAQLDTHLGDATVHFTESSIDHTNITGIGSNSHAVIDTHLADATVHFTEASIAHSNITGVGLNSHSQIDGHLSDDTKHRIINDAGASATELWSASKIGSELSGKASTTHAASHLDGAADEVDVELMGGISTLTPANYFPSTAEAGCDATDQLCAHLKGIDNIVEALSPSEMNTLATSGSGANTIDTQTAASDELMELTVKCTAMADDGSEGGSMKAVGTFRKDGAATIVQVSTTTMIYQNQDCGAGANSCDLTMAISGASDVLIQVDGSTGPTNINWDCLTEIRRRAA